MNQPPNQPPQGNNRPSRPYHSPQWYNQVTTIALCLIVLTMSCLALASCFSAGPPDGYLSSSDTHVDFIQFTEKDNQLNGHIQEVRMTNDVPLKLQTTTIPFTGEQNGSSVTITFTFLGLSVSSVTGTFNGTTLTLAIPQQDGHLVNETFTGASIQDYNQAVDILQKQIDQQNQKYADSQSTASANQATQTAQQSEQQAVSDANARLANSLDSLNNDASGLASFSESSTLDGYANDWKSMQNDYATEQQDAQAGCGDGNYNYGTVQYDAGTVDYDYGSIQYDDGSLNYDKNTYHSELSAVQSDIQSVNNAWSSLQQAVANNTTGTPAPKYTASDVNNALQSAQNSEQKAQSVWKSAKSTAAQYDQKASALKQKADALPASMHCN